MSNTPNTDLSPILLAIGRLEGLMQGVLADRDKTAETARGLDRRITALEAFRWKIVGVVVAVSVIAPIALKYGLEALNP